MMVECLNDGKGNRLLRLIEIKWYETYICYLYCI
jgi:hypothetical protein